MAEQDCYLIYRSPQLDSYLARSRSGRLYLVPDQLGGWAERTPMQRRPRAKIEPVADAGRIVDELGGRGEGERIACLRDDLTLPLAEAAAAADLPLSTIKNAVSRGSIPTADDDLNLDLLVTTAALRQYLEERYHPRPTRRDWPHPAVRRVKPKQGNAE